MIDVSDDLYSLLEVSPFATQEEIKKAYHTVAKKYHPDVYHGPDSEQRFQKINSAYQILSNPTQRAKYDSFVNTINTQKQSASQTNSGASKQSDFNVFIDIEHNLYTELDLDLFASTNEIEKSYKTLSEKYNPDTSLVPNSREKLRRITFAYTILSNQILKERYDYLLRIIVKNTPKKENTEKQSNTQSSAGKTKNPSYSASSTKPGSANSQSTYSSGYSNSYESNYKYREKHSDDNYQPAPNNKSDIGCGKFISFLVLGLLAIYLLATCSNSTNKSSYNSSSYYRPTSTVSLSGKSIFTKKEIEIEIGKTFNLGYKLPDSKEYTYNYDPDYIKASNHPNRISIKGLKVGKTFIYMYNDKNQLVDTCIVRIKSAQKAPIVPTNTKNSNTQTPKATATKKAPTRTPTPVPDWAFEKEKLIVKINESVELHFTTPPYAIYTYIPEKYGVFTTTDKNPTTVIITGLKTGTGKLFLRNNNNEIVAECIISVTGNSQYPQTPTPLTGKSGGYTEQELIQNGYVGTKQNDGTMFYPGFYQAPNGNYYPTGN